MTEIATTHAYAAEPIAPEANFGMLAEQPPVDREPPVVAPSAPVGEPSGQEDPASWSYTSKAEDVRRLRQELELARGREQPRHSIGRDTPLAEGVYEGSYGGEAIVLDYDADPQAIDSTIDAVLAKCVDPKSGEVDKQQILDAVFTTVSQRMRYDSAEVDRIFEKGLGGKDGSKVSLSAYIELGVGECRHQALYAGLVLEKLRDRGYVRGVASVDRNMIKSGPDGKYDGHAWVRYTNSAGEVYILDIAQQKIGTLDEMVAARTADPSRTWDYRRPEDIAGTGHTEPADTVKRIPPKPAPYDESTYKNSEGIIDRLPWQT